MAENLLAYHCPNSDDLRGQGIADNVGMALTNAQREISAQIESQITAVTKDKRKSIVDSSGKESLQSTFSVSTQVFTHLQNAQDAKTIATVTQDRNIGIVACMRKSDAAKPFITEINILQDSLALSVNIFENQQHPIIKNSAFKTARQLYDRINASKAIVEGLGMPFEDKPGLDFEPIQHKYNEFLSQYAFYYQADSSSDADVKQRQQLIFQRISEKYPVRHAECQNGLLLKANVSPAECTEKSLGVTCTSILQLSGTNCGGESYFNIHATVKGIGRYDANEAKARLNEAVSNGAWFDEWTIELDKWRLE